VDRPDEIVLVRHGETEWTRTGQHTGKTDIPLTDQGRREAETLGARLRGRQFALILTSPLSRAVETCRLAALPGPVEIDPDLVEWDYGDYEGRPTQEIRQQRPGWFLWRDGVPNGETVEQVGVRADRVLARLHTVDGDVALFAHGHILRILTSRWLGLPPDAGRLFALSPATLSALAWEHETPVIQRWNDQPG
jgi:broad specificity phosphatase PhoE